MSSEKLIRLVNLWAEYEKENPGGDIAGFCRSFLIRSELKTSMQAIQLRPIKGRIGKILGRLYKFSIFYSKKVLNSMHISNMDNFVYLASIRELGTPKKSELILYCQSEFSSGIGIISRLIEKNWISEVVDEEDSRAKRLRLTPEGLKVLEACFPEMKKVGDMIFKGFTEDELLIFHALGKKMDDLHTGIYPQAKNKSIQELLEIADQKLMKLYS